MNEKDLYKDFNNVNIGEHEFDDIEVNMTDIQKSNLKRNLKTNLNTKKFVKTKIAAGSVAAALTVIIGVGFTNPSFASSIRILNPIVQMRGYTGDYENHTDIVNKTVTCNGKSFTINNVTCFDNNIIIGYTAKSNEKLDARGPLFAPTFKVNGKLLNVGFGGRPKNLDEYTAIGTIELMQNDMILPDDFNFNMSFNKLGDTDGNWNLDFNVSKENLGKLTKVYKPNQAVVFKNHNFTISKVTLNPLCTMISVHNNLNGGKQEVPPEILVYDDKGNALEPGAGNGVIPDANGDLNIPYQKVNEDTKYLTIVTLPANDEYKPSESVPINTKLPIQLSAGFNRKVTLTKVEYSNDNDSVSIQAIIDGKIPSDKIPDDIVGIEGDDSKCPFENLGHTIKKIGNNKYEFTIKYSGLKNDKNYRITAPNIDYYYDSKVTVKLK